MNRTDRRAQWITALLALLMLLSTAVTAYAEGGNGDGSGGGKDQPLTLVSSSVANGDTIDTTTPKIELTFSKNVVNFTVRDKNMKCFSMTDEDGKSVSIEVIMGDDQVDPSIKRIVTVTPKSPLTPGKTYALKIGGGVTSKSGVSIGKDTYISFTVAGTPPKTTAAPTTKTTTKPTTAKPTTAKTTTEKATKPETTTAPTTAKPTSAKPTTTKAATTKRATTTKPTATTKATTAATTARATTATTVTTVTTVTVPVSTTAPAATTAPPSAAANAGTLATSYTATTTAADPEPVTTATQTLTLTEPRAADDTAKRRSPLPFVLGGVSVAIALLGTVLIIKEKKH